MQNDEKMEYKVARYDKARGCECECGCQEPVSVAVFPNAAQINPQDLKTINPKITVISN
ncbi:hypothetical protein [Ruminiclostridium cellulolyticum]|uniref:Uncharacterized protein n=1 Tax=Ruminiclostridium cellulolyticum (strain ATCC 35319 / DSM 5812 / JCM 6584 / H10) TaxID=394503 RepID=B8I2M2_RUMCH|nr:hypothetical protein [Ruminiclostridium cellulolyticum]ACL76015.1 hypothetical protein Ccel_1664 [Ruminiclostridium cellulolyticum H10]